MPLGLMPGMDYEEKETTLHGGEAALLYSDGLVEAHDPKGEMFGFPDFRRLLPRTVGGIAGGCNPRGALRLRRGGLGTGGRHHPPYPTTLRIPKVNFGEIVKSECRKILLPRT
jgi:hypothetical protein